MKLVELRLEDSKNYIKNDQSVLVRQYLESQDKFSLEQIIIFELEKRNDNYVGYSLAGLSHNLSRKDLAQLVSKNELYDHRAIFIPKGKVAQSNTKNDKNSSLKVFGLVGQIEYSDGIKVNFNEKEKRIILTQSSPSDWVLFSSTNLQGWRIDFLGSGKKSVKNPTEEQRFNYRGLTGCLNFYNSEFNNTEINVIYGGYEDSLNLVNSSGKLKSIFIRNALYRCS